MPECHHHRCIYLKYEKGILLLLLFCYWPHLATAYLWGGEQLSIQGSDIIHENVSGREAKVKHIIRSREYLLPAQSISYSEDDRVSSFS